MDLLLRTYALLKRWPGLGFTTAFVRARRELRLANEQAGEPKKCPQCGCVLRKEDNGCTHCERKALLDGPLKRITPSKAREILLEPVTVKNGNTEFRFAFAKLFGDGAHIPGHHSVADSNRRARLLLYAIDAARTSKHIENKKSTVPNKLGFYPQRKVLWKEYTDKRGGSIERKFKVFVIADDSGLIYDVFDMYSG